MPWNKDVKEAIPQRKEHQFFCLMAIAILTELKRPNKCKYKSMIDVGQPDDGHSHSITWSMQSNITNIQICQIRPV